MSSPLLDSVWKKAWNLDTSIVELRGWHVVLINKKGAPVIIPMEDLLFYFYKFCSLYISKTFYIPVLSHAYCMHLIGPRLRAESSLGLAKSEFECGYLEGDRFEDRVLLQVAFRHFGCSVVEFAEKWRIGGGDRTSRLEIQAQRISPSVRFRAQCLSLSHYSVGIFLLQMLGFLNIMPGWEVVDKVLVIWRRSYFDWSMLSFGIR